MPKSTADLRAEQLEAIRAVLPFDRRDQLAELLTDQDVYTLRHLVTLEWRQHPPDSELRCPTCRLVVVYHRQPHTPGECAGGLASWSTLTQWRGLAGACQTGEGGGRCARG